ncbi:MAG: lactoylglutathione lyase, partial [Bradyrhizobium sp.]
GIAYSALVSGDPSGDGNMAFVRSPDLHSIELLQKGEPKPPAEPWASMPNTGHW